MLTHSRVFTWGVLGVPVAVGVWLRVVAWWAADALRADEVAIATSVTERGLLSLATRPLDYLQSAPPGWLWIERAVVSLFGLNERMLHLPQLLADVTALVVLAVVAIRLLPLAGAFVAVTLAATNQHLIFYATNLKQYSFEVLACVCLIAGAIAVARRTLPVRRPRPPWPAAEEVDPPVGTSAPAAPSAPNPKTKTSRLPFWMRQPLLLWWFGAALALTVSQTSAFVTAGLAGVLALTYLFRRDWRTLARLVVFGLIWVIALAVDWQLSLRHSAGNEFLFDYWRRLGAFPAGGGPSSDWLGGSGWLGGSSWLGALADHAMRHPFDAAWTVGALILLTYGLIRLLATIRKIGPRIDGILVLAPAVAALAATALGIYPLWERAALWLIPCGVLLAGAAVDGARRLPPFRAPSAVPAKNDDATDNQNSNDTTDNSDSTDDSENAGDSENTDGIENTDGVRAWGISFAAGGRVWRVVAGVIGVVLVITAMGPSVVGAPAATAATSATLPKIRPLLDGVRQQQRPGDVVVVESWALAWTRLYWRDSGVRTAGAVYLRQPDATCRAKPGADLLASGRRVWVVVINDPDFRPYVASGLESAMRPIGVARPVLRPDRYTTAYLLIPRRTPDPGPGRDTPPPPTTDRAHSCLTQLPSPAPFPLPG